MYVIAGKPFLVDRQRQTADPCHPDDRHQCIERFRPVLRGVIQFERRIQHQHHGATTEGNRFHHVERGEPLQERDALRTRAPIFQSSRHQKDYRGDFHHDEHRADQVRQMQRDLQGHHKNNKDDTATKGNGALTAELKRGGGGG
ncbi:hypothetical protein, partial [Breoghania sp.]|uniref:hypothetical protein n=1 Tax=Breoghania sp. TaxID=2065378 RepID=UPI002624F093